MKRRRALGWLVVVGLAAAAGPACRGARAVRVAPEADWPDAGVLVPPPAPLDAGPDAGPSPATGQGG